MKSSIFNLRVPLEGDDVFLMNTLTDAQAIVSSDVAALLDGRCRSPTSSTPRRGRRFDELVDNGFITAGPR